MGELHKLKPLLIARELSPGRYGDGGGLYLQVGNNETKSWIFRYRVGRREREMGLSSPARASFAGQLKRHGFTRFPSPRKSDDAELSFACARIDPYPPVGVGALSSPVGAWLLPGKGARLPRRERGDV